MPMPAEKTDTQMIRIFLRSEFNSIFRSNKKTETHPGNMSYCNPGEDVFSIIRRGNCVLGADDFKGSGVDHRLSIMFFRGANLDIKLKKDHAAVTLYGTMDCSIRGEKLEEGVPFRLNPGDFHNLIIEDVIYVIKYQTRELKKK